MSLRERRFSADSVWDVSFTARTAEAERQAQGAQDPARRALGDESKGHVGECSRVGAKTPEWEHEQLRSKS